MAQMEGVQAARDEGGIAAEQDDGLERVGARLPPIVLARHSLPGDAQDESPQRITPDERKPGMRSPKSEVCTVQSPGIESPQRARDVGNESSRERESRVRRDDGGGGSESSRKAIRDEQEGGSESVLHRGRATVAAAAAEEDIIDADVDPRQAALELASHVHAMVAGPAARLSALSAEAQQQMLIESIYQQRLDRLAADRRRTRSEGARMRRRLHTMRGEIAHMWQLQLAALRPGDYVWLATWILGPPSQAAVFERRILMSIVRREGAGFVLVAGRDAPLLYGGPYQDSTPLAEIGLIPSPAGDHNESAIIDAFFSSALILFQ